VIHLDAVALRGRLALPHGVKVDGVLVGVAGEVGEDAIAKSARAAVGLNEEGMVATLGIDVLESDFGDVWRVLVSAYHSGVYVDKPASVPRGPTALPPERLQKMDSMRMF
jgi:hypothetical protein